jgi:hypothetical protein
MGYFDALNGGKDRGRANDQATKCCRFEVWNIVHAKSNPSNPISDLGIKTQPEEREIVGEFIRAL